ncbi:unnamed protein product [Mesocestoides corti]|uniref:Uncharacterized protein n=1 Tax=Mesocestoides corti TaxID=53468 RepID=A0A0R3UHB9_MESCO|nr:unnamed protein product [Mesocestoides corti]
MTFEASIQPHCSCCSSWFNAIDQQRRHFCLGLLIGCFSSGIIIAEFRQPSPLYTGYWVGGSDCLATTSAIVCALKPHRFAFIGAALTDAICSVITCAGGIQVLATQKTNIFTTGWLSTVQLIFLLYHCCSCVIDADALCRFRPFGRGQTVSSNPSSQGLPIQSTNRRAQQRPPSDFRLPDEAPKLPGYFDLTRDEGLPPDYSKVNTAPPGYETQEQATSEAAG